VIPKCGQRPHRTSPRHAKRRILLETTRTCQERDREEPKGGGFYWVPAGTNVHRSLGSPRSTKAVTRLQNGPGVLSGPVYMVEGTGFKCDLGSMITSELPRLLHPALGKCQYLPGRGQRNQIAR